ncbi:MAG: extracellular solute-binding protein [Candidatus Omnitrophota bacterium]
MKYRLATVLFFFIVSSVLTASPAEKPILRVLNWSEFIAIDDKADPSLPIPERSPVLRQFMKEQNCSVEYYVYDSIEDLYRRTENMQGYYDVLIIPVDIAKKFLIEERLYKFTPNQITNKNVISKEYAERLKSLGDYFLPYLIGTTGIAYRKDLTGREIENWKDYFEPPQPLKGKLAAQNTFVTLFFALNYLGIDIKTQDDKKAMEAAQVFYALKKNGFIEFSNNVINIQNELLRGDLAMAIMYSSDALSVMAEDASKNICYIVPKEGGELGVDGVTVLNDAPHKDLALKFADFMLKPEIHAANAVYLNSWCPNDKAVAIIKKSHPEYFNNPNINLSPEIRERIEIYSNPALEKEMRRLWSQIADPLGTLPFLF